MLYKTAKQSNSKSAKNIYKKVAEALIEEVGKEVYSRCYNYAKVEITSKKKHNLGLIPLAKISNAKGFKYESDLDQNRPNTLNCHTDSYIDTKDPILDNPPSIKVDLPQNKSTEQLKDIQTQEVNLLTATAITLILAITAYYFCKNIDMNLESKLIILVSDMSAKNSDLMPSSL